MSDTQLNTNADANADIVATQPGMEPVVTPEVAAVGEKIMKQVRLVYDPEIPVNIYDLGLIYKIDIKPLPDNKVDVEIEMTLTTPNCPVAGEMPRMVQSAVEVVEEVNDVKVNLVWEPTWDKSMMSDEAKLQLNMF